MKHFLLAGLAGGAAMALLTNLPLLALGNCLLCLWVWGGGLFSAWLYRRLQGSVTVNQGGWLGAFAGFLGGLVSGWITFSRGTGAGLLPGQISSVLPMEYEEQLQLLGMLQDMVATFALMEVFAFVFLGAVGGLLGGLLFRPKPVSPAEPEAGLRVSPTLRTAPAGFSESLPADENPLPAAEPPAQPALQRTFTPPPQPRPLEGRGELPPEEYPPEDAPL